MSADTRKSNTTPRRHTPQPNRGLDRPLYLRCVINESTENNTMNVLAAHQSFSHAVSDNGVDS